MAERPCRAGRPDPLPSTHRKLVMAFPYADPAGKAAVAGAARPTVDVLGGLPASFVPPPLKLPAAFMPQLAPAAGKEPCGTAAVLGVLSQEATARLLEQCVRACLSKDALVCSASLASRCCHAPLHDEGCHCLLHAAGQGWGCGTNRTCRMAFPPAGGLQHCSMGCPRWPCSLLGHTGHSAHAGRPPRAQQCTRARRCKARGASVQGAVTAATMVATAAAQAAAHPLPQTLVMQCPADVRKQVRPPTTPSAMPVCAGACKDAVCAPRAGVGCGC